MASNLKKAEDELNSYNAHISEFHTPLEVLRKEVKAEHAQMKREIKQAKKDGKL